MNNKVIKKAIFPVGGLGTRFLPATKAVPKEMLPVACKPLIQYAYEEAMQAGIEECIFVTGRNKYAINTHFDHAYELQSVLKRDDKHEFLDLVKASIPASGNIAYVSQLEPAGLGHAIACAENFINNEPFAVILADEMVLNGKGLLSQMVEAYNDVGGGNIVAVAEVPEDMTHKYGILDPEQSEGSVIKAKGMVEKPKPDVAPSNLSLTGRYILHPEIMPLLKSGKRGAGNEIQLTDAMAELLTQQNFYGFKFEGQRFDCGSLEGFLEANIAYSLADSRLNEGAQNVLRKFNNRF